MTNDGTPGFAPPLAGTASGPNGRPLPPPRATELQSEPEPPPGPNRAVIAAVAFGIILLIGLAVFALASGGSSSVANAGGFLQPVRADPSGTKRTFDVDGKFSPAKVINGLLLLVDTNDQGTISKVKAVTLKDGKAAWSHSAESFTAVGSLMFINDSGHLRQLDTAGKLVGASKSIDDTSVLGTVNGRLIVYGPTATSAIDPATLKVVADNITPTSCSPNGSFCVLVEYDASSTTSTVTLIDMSTGKSIGKPVDVGGFANSYALDDGRFVVLDGSDLVIYSKTGKESSRTSVSAGSKLALVVGDLAIVQNEVGTPRAWSLTAKPAALGATGPHGFIRPSSDGKIVLVATDNGVQACALGEKGFSCRTVIDGGNTEVAVGQFYVTSATSATAYDISNDKKLWSINKRLTQLFQALDGKVALYSFGNTTTTITIYG